MTAPGGWFTDLITPTLPGTAADATNVVPALLRPRAATLSDYGRFARKIAGGVAGGIAKVPEQIAELGVPLGQVPAGLPLQSDLDKPGPRTRRPMDISTPVRDFVGGPLQNVSDSSASSIGDFAGQIAGWELGARSGLLGKLKNIGLKTEEVSPEAKRYASTGKLIKALQREGGATLHPNGEAFGGTAYMVADPTLTTVVKNAKEMRAFLARPDVKEGLASGKLIGKWTDPETGLTEINLSDPLQDHKAALKLAAQRGEQAAGHIADGAYQGDVANPHAPVRAVQELLAGMRTGPQMRRITEIPATHGHQLAQAFEALPKNDPAAKGAYDALNREVEQQYKAIQDAGYKVEFTDADPYKNSAEMIKDVRDNKTLKVFKTPRPEETVATAAIRLEDGRVVTGVNHGAAWEKAGEPETYADGFLTTNGRFVDRKEAYTLHTGLNDDGHSGVQKLTADELNADLADQGSSAASTFHPYMTPEQNDRFRAVHDFLAHAGGGNQFGAVGEENAYRVHASTLSPEAQQALAAETRGQNSWVNFGPNSHLPVKERPFAEQKAALFPKELLGDYDSFGPRTWTPAQLEAYGVQHGVPGLGRVSPRHEVTLTNGEKVNVPGGYDGTFSYHDLLSLKAEGINPNLLPEGIHEKIHAKMVRSMTPEDMSDPELFRALSFGLTSPNSPLTPNEFTVSRLMPRSMEDISRLAKADPKTLPHALGVDAASKGGLGTSGSVDYANVVKLAQLFEKNPKWFRRAADEEPWDQYVDRLATQIPGLGTKTASLGAVWQDLPNAAVSAVDRHMTELAMPHILQHPELGPDFAARAVKSWNGQAADVLASKGGPVKSLDELRQRDPIYTRDFLASLINDPHKFNFRTSKGEFGKNVPESMRMMDFIEEPEQATMMNPYYREALAYNAAQQGAGESLFASQWRLWDRLRGRIEPHEVMFPGLNRLPRMDIEDARAALQAHKAANYTRSGNAAVLLPKAEGAAAHMPAVKRLLDPMTLAYWGLGGLAVGAAADERR